jgi:hypothetical protein
VVANNRFSADAFVVAASVHREAPDGTMRHGVSLERALERLESCSTDNAAVRCLETLGLASRDLTSSNWARFDVDTPLDLALLRLATRLPGLRRPEASVSSFLEMARLPGGKPLAVPNIERIGSVIRNRVGELVIAGRIPAALLRELETESACRVRAFVEERGMRSARDQRPRSLLARWLQEHGPAGLVTELAALGDAVVLDTRVLMAALSGSAEEHHWPPAEERFASDFGDTAPIRTDWLRELVEAVNASRVPFLLGGHALIADGLSMIVASAWVGR